MLLETAAVSSRLTFYIFLTALWGEKYVIDTKWSKSCSHKWSIAGYLGSLLFTWDCNASWIPYQTRLQFLWHPKVLENRNEANSRKPISLLFRRITSMPLTYQLLLPQLPMVIKKEKLRQLAHAPEKNQRTGFMKKKESHLASTVVKTIPLSTCAFVVRNIMASPKDSGMTLKNS